MSVPTTTSINGEAYTLEEAEQFWGQIVGLTSKLVGLLEQVDASYRTVRLDARALGYVHGTGEAVEQVRVYAQEALNDLRSRHGAVKEVKDATKATADEAFYH